MSSQVDAWHDSPSLYAKDVFGINRVWRKAGDFDREPLKPGDRPIWWGQEEMLEACTRGIRERKFIYVGTGHSLGKDFIYGTVGPWFLQTFIPSLVVLTGPTDRQVKDIMWKETKSHWDRRLVDLGGKAFTDPRIEIEKDWYLTGFTTKETTQSREAGGAKFQGLKGKSNVCVIVTEAQAIENMIRDQIDAITTSQNVLVIFLGNPTLATGWFAKGLNDPVTNIVLQYSCLQSPNYIEGREVIPGLVGKAWVEDKRVRWGEDDPRWVGRVLGKVPSTGLNQVFSPDLLNHMKERHGRLGKFSDNRGVAVDTSGQGVDENVFMAGSNGDVLDVFTKTLMSPGEVALKALEMCHAIGGSWIVFDADGLGQRDYAEALKLSPAVLRGVTIHAFYGSAPSEKYEVIVQPDGKEIRKPMYRNQRAEAAFNAKDRGRAGKATINPQDLELIEDLEQDRWIEGKTPTQIIDKIDIKEILKRSPGRADAYKMLQWMFEKNLPPSIYKNVGNQLPQYAIVDQDINQGMRGQTLPGYATTE